MCFNSNTHVYACTSIHVVCASVGVCVQRFRHNTLCRHELGRRLAGFTCVQLLPGRQMVWVPNKEDALLPFDENLERLGMPTAVR